MTSETDRISLENFRLASGQRYMGIDLGSRTIGLAVSDTRHRVATPLETIRRRKFGLDAARLLEIAESHDVGCFVIGLPVNMDGTSGPRVQATRAFVRNMKRLSDIPFVYWDERLSTAAAERVLLEADATRASRARVIDKMAAAYILQGALDRLAVIARDGREKP
ncbi:MAG TPA: Holliday junction resolvase RuvX [Rhizobiales bacterium]|nr:Holliday junction resolvase RuvX [Hyphomicrobiales bacterium]